MLARPPILAGTWYPGDADELAREVDGFLRDARAVSPPPSRPLAVISPHAGYVYSGGTAAHAFAGLSPGSHDRVIVLAISHYHSYPGASMLDVDAYETPLGRIPLIPRDERERMRRTAGLCIFEEAHAREHSLEIQLPFLQRALGEGWELVPILVRDLDGDGLRRLGRALRPWFDDRTLVVASTDFTHHGHRFGYEPFPTDAHLFTRLAELDGGAVERILARDSDGLLEYQRTTGITMCGIKPVACMLHLLPADAEGRALAYDTSGRMTDDLEHSVSYQAMSFVHRFPELPISSTLEERILAEARETLRCAAVSESRPRLDGDPSCGLPDVDVFVTLRVQESGELRGCIGSIGDTSPILRAVRGATLAAATRDPRFPAVEADEVAALRISVSVLTPPRPIEPDEIELGRHGLVLEGDGARGVFLPQVPVDHGWDSQTYLEQLCEKASVPGGSWRRPEFTLRGFESIAIGE